MKLIMFSKTLKSQSVKGLIELAQDWGFDGYDLCVREGYVVNPANVAEALPAAVAGFRENGLDIPMVTAEGGLLQVDDPTAEPILSAMDKADVRLIKLGYFRFDPATQDYWEEVGKVREALGKWEEMGKRFGVKICYHTHSNRCLGLNGAAMAHLVQGFDPQYIGAYIDAGHMLVEGEEFSYGLAMIQKHLSIVAVKDVRMERIEENGHGKAERHWVRAGEGMVDWTTVFGDLGRAGFDGPVSIHCEFRISEEERLAAMKAEAAFFRRFV